MDPQEFRKTIPLLRNNPDIVYLDSATTTLMPDCVLKKITEFYEEIGVIPNRGAYDLVLESDKILKNIRKTVSEFLNVKIDRIAFTTSTSHGSATAVSLADLEPKDRVLFASNLHNSSFLNWFRAVKKKSLEYTFIDLNPDGQISLDDLEKKLAKNSIGKTIVVLDHVPMGFGQILPLKETSNLIHERDNCFLYLDATRSAGMLDIDISSNKIDYLVCQGHTGLFGPQGTGILIFPDKKLGEPIYIGSGSVVFCTEDEYQVKETPESIETDGTNIGGLVGLGAGIDLMKSIGISKIQEHCRKLFDILFNNPHISEKLHFIGENKSENKAGLISFIVNGMNPHDVAFYLAEMDKIYVRAGELCSHLLMEKAKLSTIYGAVQLSVHYYNNERDIARICEAILENL